MTHTTTARAATIGLVLAALLVLPEGARAETCSFTTDLTLGTQNEQVRCLQRYLNDHGYTIAASGVGSPGHETTQFKTLTLAAVKKWQEANGIAPATGTFGAKSRAKYLALTTVGTPATPTTPSTPVVSADSLLESQTREALIKARESLKEVEDDINEAEDSKDDVGNAKEYFDDAEEDLFNALIYFLKKEYSNALDSSLSLTKAIRSARNEIRENVDEEDKAKGAIDDAKSEIEDAEDAITEADDRGKNVSDAEDLLEKAKDAYTDAKSLFKNDKFDDAYDRARDAEKYAEDAQDEL